MSVVSELIHEPIPRRLSIPFELNTESPQARGLVGWWPTIGPGAAGAVAQGLAGARVPITLTNAPPYVADPTVGRMLSFNGTTQTGAAVPGAIPTFQQTTPFSIVFWFASTDADGPIINTAYAGLNAGLQIDINAGSIRGLLLNAAFSAGRIARTTSTALASGALTHVVVTYSGNSAASGWSFYINGALVAATSVLDTTPGTLGDIGVVLGFNGSAIYAGSVSDVRVYNRLLSASEVSRLYAPQTRWELYRPSEWRTIVRGSVASDRSLTGSQPAASGVLTRQLAALRALAGVQPTATGALSRIYQALRALAGDQPTATGTLAFSHGYPRSLAGSQPAATGTVARALQALRSLAGSQPTATGTLARLLAALRSLAGDQPSATGVLSASLGLIERLLTGAQPAASGALSRVLQAQRALAGNQPTSTGTLARIFQTTRLLAGDQPTPTGALARIKQALRALAGDQPAATGVLTRVKQASRSLVGSQPTATGTLTRLLAAFRSLVGSQPTGTGVLSRLLAALRSLAGNQPAASADLTRLRIVLLAGDQPSATGVLTTDVPVAAVITPPSSRVSIQTSGRTGPPSIQTSIRRQP